MSVKQNRNPTWNVHYDFIAMTRQTAISYYFFNWKIRTTVQWMSVRYVGKSQRRKLFEDTFISKTYKNMLHVSFLSFTICQRLNSLIIVHCAQTILSWWVIYVDTETFLWEKSRKIRIVFLSLSNGILNEDVKTTFMLILSMKYIFWIVLLWMLQDTVEKIESRFSSIRFLD